MKLFGWLVPMWVRWAVLAAVVALLVGAGWTINGWRHRAADADKAEKALATYQQQVATRDRDHLADLAGARARAEALASDLAAQRAAYGELLAAIPHLKLTETRYVPADAQGRCPVPVRSAAYRLCNNAAWSGDAAAIAACGTIGRDAADGKPLSAAGLVRPRDP